MEIQAELEQLRTRVTQLEQAEARQMQTERTMSQNQVLLSAIYNNSPMLMGLVEILEDDIRHLSDNFIAARFFGRSAEELRGKLASELGVPSQHIKEWVNYYRQSALLGEPVRFEYFHETPQGQVRFASTVFQIEEIEPSVFSDPHSSSTTSITPAKKSNRFCYITEDITRQYELEEKLRASEEKYKQLFQICPLGISITDQDGKFIEINPAAKELFDGASTNITNHTITNPPWKTVLPDCTPLPVEEFASVRALREKRLMSQIEQGIVRPDGKLIWLNVTAAPLLLKGYGVVIAYTDITKLKQVEEERARLAQLQTEDQLRESEARFRALFEYAAVGIAQVGLDGAWQTVNERLCEIAGYTRKELLALTFQDITYHEDYNVSIKLDEKLKW